MYAICLNIYLEKKSASISRGSIKYFEQVVVHIDTDICTFMFTYVCIHIKIHITNMYVYIHAIM